MGDNLFHDWQKLVTELLATGLTQQQIAAKIGCSQGLVSQIKNGLIKGDLSSGIGTRLLGLHRYHTRIKTAKDK